MVKVTKEKKLKLPTKVRIYITAGFNNTLVTVTDNQGNTLFWYSCGRAGFKGTRKSTPFAATTTIKYVIDKLEANSVAEADVFLKGPGPGRDSALKLLRHTSFKINSLVDVTPIPHNGCRPKKPKKG